MIRALLLCLALSSGPAEPASAPPSSAPVPPVVGGERQGENEPAPPKVAPKTPVPPMAPAPEPDVKRAVEKMQRFYEETKDFTASFQQTYRYKSFATTKKASGRVRFMKAGGSMRWDYLKPDDKVFVISGRKIYSYDKEAKQLAIASIDTDRLSASVTFLWGQGKLEREFDVRKADRKDLVGGIALELTPKVPDPRFREVFFLLDPMTYAVRESLVIDPDGSENTVAFSEVKTNTGFSNDVFKIDYPKDTQILRLDSGATPPPP